MSHLNLTEIIDSSVVSYESKLCGPRAVGVVLGHMSQDKCVCVGVKYQLL
jgi:hypothetical protein